MSGGVDYEAAEAVCAQYGARLVSSSSLEERQDLLEYYRNKREESDCSADSQAYWLRSEGGRCEVWLADSPGLSLPGQFKLTAAPCNLSQLDSLQLQPLCETRLEDSSSAPYNLSACQTSQYYRRRRRVGGISVMSAAQRIH